MSMFHSQYPWPTLFLYFTLYGKRTAQNYKVTQNIQVTPIRQDKVLTTVLKELFTSHLQSSASPEVSEVSSLRLRFWSQTEKLRTKWKWCYSWQARNIQPSHLCFNRSRNYVAALSRNTFAQVLEILKTDWR